MENWLSFRHSQFTFTHYAHPMDCCYHWFLDKTGKIVRFFYCTPDIIAQDTSVVKKLWYSIAAVDNIMIRTSIKEHVQAKCWHESSASRGAECTEWERVALPDAQWVAAPPWSPRPLRETPQFTTTSSSSACIDRLMLLGADGLLRKSSSSSVGSGSRIITPPPKRPSHVNTETEVVQTSIEQSELRFYVVLRSAATDFFSFFLF